MRNNMFHKNVIGWKIEITKQMFREDLQTGGIEPA